ncbi:MAG TPA: hypothetical protein VKU82_08575 [Planctomycetaceae bacterium]|nr:hypothetical protein [Planctomycetaceae bacterium]
MLIRLILFAALAFPVGQAEPGEPDVQKSLAEHRLAFARQAAALYRFRIPRREKVEVKLHPEPLLRWNNQVVREDDGMLFLWTERAKGRPLATAQFFLVENAWHHEFQSLCLSGFDARMEGTAGDGWSWQPNRPGLEFVPAENADPPAGAAGLRVRQMKSIAERFTAAVDRRGKFECPDELRLLTTPVYRYSATDQGVVDGAMFAFVQGTNPEVLVLVEAVETGPGTKVWRYGFARMSSFYLRVRRGDQVVWEQSAEPVPTRDRAGPYFFRFGAQTDRSHEIELAP